MGKQDHTNGQMVICFDIKNLVYENFLNMVAITKNLFHATLMQELIWKMSIKNGLENDHYMTR